jgi:putative membrane protein
MIAQLLNFLAYFATSLALLTAYVALYIRITPYQELRLIRDGNLAAALALLGAIGGFTLPVASAIAHSVSLADMAVWSIVAMAVQSLVYVTLARSAPALPQGIAAGNTAHGAWLGGASLCVGLINAACMTY